VHGSDFRNTISDIRREIFRNQENYDEKKNSICGRYEDDTKSMQVYVRKRPMLEHEPEKKEYDIVTCLNENEIVVHDCQMYAGMKHCLGKLSLHIILACGIS